MNHATTHKSFEEFLEEYWFDHLAEGQSKDASMEAIERWMCNLDVEELIGFADLYGDWREMQALKPRGAHGY